MIQFYAPGLPDDTLLPESDSRHAVKVLRLQPGDELQAIDGRGGVYTCRMVDAHQRHALIEIVEHHEQPLPWKGRITIAVAPTKHMDRMEWLTEKLTEIGVNAIVPLLCKRSERREIKTERLEKIAVSAMKQSLKAVLPAVEPMTPVMEVIKKASACPGMLKFIAYCGPEVPRRELACEYQAATDVTILIGPEGDFTPEEVKAALDAGFVAVTLGQNRLRTETAALVACDTCHIIDTLSN